MKFNDIFKKLSFITITKYIFIFAIAAKAVHFYATQHPSKEGLLSVNGVVHQVHLGGQGTSTYFLVESNNEINRYFSYYGKVWPGMENIEKGDKVSILAERNKLKKGQFITGKEFWIWELTKGDYIVVKYEDVLNMVNNKETHLNQDVNWFLFISIILLLLAYVWKGLSTTLQ